MNNQSKKMELLGSASIPKALLSMGIPTMIGMLVNAFYNLVDAYFVGGLGESQMGAISVVYPLGQVVVGLGLLFGNGAASYISRLLGRGDKENANKVVYSLTDAGNEEFEKLMIEISCKPINIFLDFNAVIVNLESMAKEQQRECLDHIESNINVLKSYLEENISMKENAPDIPATGMAVLHQQFLLVQAIEEWIATLKKKLG